MNTDFEQAMQAALQASRADDTQATLAHLQRAAALEPASPAPYFVLGAHYAQARDNDLAEAAYLECLQRAPGFAIARFQLGLLQLTTGRPAVAQVSWGPLLQRDDADALKLFAQGLIATLAGDATTARECLQKGISLNLDNAPLNVDMQGVLDRLDREAPPPAPRAAGGAGDHFLIGAYRQGR